jgi:hypothetical protein
MVEMQRERTIATTVTPVVENAVSNDTVVGLRNEIAEIEYAVHCEALRFTRLEIKYENDVKSLVKACFTLQSGAEEDRCSIARLSEELRLLKGEHVTLKRREEALKARYLSSIKATTTNVFRGV